MQGTQKDKVRYFYEYAIADVIKEYNAANVASRIMVSEGRTLHDRIEQDIARDGYDLSNVGISRFQRAVNSVCGERMGENPYKTEQGRDPRLSAQLVKFNSIVQFQKNVSENGYLPISPYDKRFADRDIVRKNGSNMLYMRAFDIQDIGDAAKFINGRKITAYSLKEKDDGFHDTPVGVLTSREDFNGTSMLMGYMTQDEYDAVSPWIAHGNADIDWDNLSDDEVNRIVDERHNAMEKSIAILQGLRDMGIPYTISRDQQPGQVQAELTGTKIRVRITDTPANQLYVGRVYDNGCSVYYSTTRKENGVTARYNNPTPEDCLNLVKFALNQPIKQKDSDKQVGEVGTYDINWYKKNKAGGYDKKVITNNAAVQTSKTFTAIAGPYVGADGKPDKFGHKIIMRADLSDRSASTTYFKDVQAAEDYLKSSIESARENFISSVGAERLIKEYNKHKDDPDYIPEFNGNPTIAVIQQSYWDLLTGKQSDLLIPGETADEYEEFVGDVGEYRNGTPAEQAVFKAMVADITYSHDEYPTPEDMIRKHAEDNVNYVVGNYDMDDTGKRFDPVGVSTYMTSAYGIYRNNDDIVAALRLTGMNADELKGNDFYNQVLRDRLIKFDKDSAVRMNQHESPFIQRMGREVYESLQRSGCEVNEDDIYIDDNGVVSYTASIYTKMSASKDSKVPVHGEIGQIFIPDEEGKLETKFAGTPNYICVPGYEAEIMPQKPGEVKNVAERTKLRGYEQIMRDQIRYQIRQDTLGAKSEIGSPASCNGVYRRLYDERHPLDFVEQYQQQGMEDSLIHAIIQTEARRVRYSNFIREGSTINADYNAIQYGSTDMDNDNFGDAYCLTGGKNMSIMDEEGDGYFDPIATGTSTNQGITRYLVEGSEVQPDGFIKPSDDKNARTPLMAHDVCKFMDYNPFDRQQMTVSNLMQASAVSKPVKVAQMTFGGWTQDDPAVVSKKFAHEYQMRNHDGNMRDLVIGDKISDLNGNKGVISLVIDPDMDLEEAERQGIKEQVEWFKANPDLDVVMAPFPAVSRFNGGSTRELMENPSDLIAPDGTVYEGCIGEMRMIITDKAADIKTHVYDDDDLAEGKGRKVSAQLAWALNAQDCPAIMSECYGANNGATANLREMLITMGLDMDETGTLRTEYKPHEGEVRQVFEMPELKYTATGALDTRKLREDFSNKIGAAGGIMEVPFPMDYITGAPVPPLNDGKTDVVYKAEEWTRRGYTRKDGTYVRPTTVRRHDDAGTKRQVGNVTYGLPVLSSYLRSGQEFEDGTVSVHDYTNQYLSIFEQSMRYIDAQNRLNDPANKNNPKRSDWERTLVQAPQKAQAAYNNIAQDLERRKFTGKHNVFRDDLMSHRMPNSSTAVWTADPRLDVDQIAIGSCMAETMGLKKNDYVLCWRDPVLRDSGVRYLRVKIDENLTGVAISPVMDKCFDGDFDGDTVGILKLRTKAAQKEAMAKLSVDANLLDYGSKNSEGLYDIAMQNSLDIKVAQHNNPALAERWAQMTRDINELEEARKNDEISDDSYFRTRRVTVEELSDYYRDCYKNQCGAAMVSYNSMPEHIDSLVHGCVETGAKGNMKKIKDYLKYLGVECELKDDKFDYSTLKDNGSTLATRSDMEDVEYATAVKAFGTGVAGMYSQRGVRGLRNDCQKAVLELTYPVTQSILQAKHDPIDARHKYQMLMGSCRQLWKGYEMEYNDMAETWVAKKGPDGKPLQAETEQWKRQFIDIYTSDKGLGIDINRDYVDTVAKALTDDTGHILSIEEGAAERGSLMDRLAYGGTFKPNENTDCAISMSVVGAAKNGENIFDGKYNVMFAPKVIRDNRQIVNDKAMATMFTSSPELAEKAANESVKGFAKGDVKDGGKKSSGKQSVAVGGSVKHYDVSHVTENTELNNGVKYDIVE